MAWGWMDGGGGGVSALSPRGTSQPSLPYCCSEIWLCVQLAFLVATMPVTGQESKYLPVLC